MITTDAGDEIVKARYFGDEDGEYAKLVVHRDLLDDHEELVCTLDALRDELGDVVMELEEAA